MSEQQQNEAEEQQKEQQTAENAAAEETAANASDNTEETPAAEETQQPSELELAQKKIDELNDKDLRLSAEYDNYRKRTLKEKSDMLKSAGTDDAHFINCVWEGNPQFLTVRDDHFFDYRLGNESDAIGKGNAALCPSEARYECYFIDFE